MPTISRAATIAAAIIGTLIAVTTAMRLDDIRSPVVEARRDTRYSNAEVVTHTASAVLAYHQAWRHGITHGLQPAEPYSRADLVTGRRVQPIARGAGAAVSPGSPFQPANDGGMAYLSFPATPFIATAAILDTVDIPPTIPAIRATSVALHGALISLVAAFVWLATAPVAGVAGRVAGTFIAGLAMATAPQAWHAGVEMWPPHYWAQVAFLLLAILFAFLPAGRLRVLLVGLAAMASAAMEWTGYLVAGGFWAATLLLTWREPGQRRRWLIEAGAIALGTAAALAITLYEVTTSTTLTTWLSTIQHRAADRSSGHDRSVGLVLICQGLAVGGWLLTLASLGATVAMKRRLSLQLSPCTFAVTVMWLSVVENFLMRDHAATYGFDQLKLVAAVAVSCGILAARLLASPRERLLVSASSAAGLWLSAWLSSVMFDLPARPQDGGAHRIATQIAAETALDELPIMIGGPNTGGVFSVDAWLGERIYGASNINDARRILLATGWSKGRVFEITLGSDGSPEITAASAIGS